MGHSERRSGRETWPDLGVGEPPRLSELIGRALAEDLVGGDVTARAVVPRGRRARACVVARQDMVVCGSSVARDVFAFADSGTVVDVLLPDAARAVSGDVVMRLDGEAAALLAAERTALNLLQRACGVATLTSAYVDAAAGKVRVVDTRKTMPGLRALDRYAVRCGGGHNHRNDLGSGVLIKENHIRMAGGVGEAVRRAIAFAPHGLRIECEVNTLAQLTEAIDAGARFVMLDNMDDETIARAVDLAEGRVGLEVSGGVTLERLPTLAGLGVDLVSVGALTHSAPAADLSLLFDA
ncbi:MAG: carboxylating nicotinate-nucleotide diphosphorylase [Nannocystaceae bacterium]